MIPFTELDGFIDEVFGNILEVRRANRQLLEVLNIRQREQSLVIQRVGDIFLEIAAEFRLVYAPYVGHLPLAEKRLKEETEGNHEFRLFLEVSALFAPVAQEVCSCVEWRVERKSPPRRSEDGAQGVSEPSSGARAAVREYARSHRQGDGGRQPGRRLPPAGRAGVQELAGCVRAADLPACDGQGSDGQV